ncbi:methyltransferase domain-containing protein [Nocardioides sp. BP30]|uniref:methyltransferase domain-containing protein n=1 Tax=Nocardioides sp. BP30 TaxID=3036374 RepID=UPI0024682F11|nr:methyltransferase domain-containing protein [Nocardioides sp. BP30]WGL51914.1 methyltransferase domain-containing protein [Nocardioides sp. BP30]
MPTLFEFLADSGFIDRERAALVSERCRDAEVPVYRDPISGVIFLDPAKAGLDELYYAKRDSGAVAHPRTETDVLDATRRSALLTPLISGRRWVDFACGPGYQLRADARTAAAHLGVELNQADLALLSADGFAVTPELKDVEDFRPDVISIFHAIDQIDEAPAVLADLHRAAAPGGELVIEGVHANDWLLTNAPESFLRFTFTAEHLVLHTRASLRALVESAGWQVTEVVGVQRYPLGNHLAWLGQGRPTGMRAHLHDATELALHDAYAAFLAARDQTDTLVLRARKQ